MGLDDLLVEVSKQGLDDEPQHLPQFQSHRLSSSLPDAKQSKRLRQQEDERREEDRKTARLDEVFKHWELGAGEGVPTNQVAQALRAWTEENGNGNDEDGTNSTSGHLQCARRIFVHLWKRADAEQDEEIGFFSVLCACPCRSLFAATFNQCASHKDEGLDRIRILYLLARFYGATSQGRTRESYGNPRRWMTSRASLPLALEGYGTHSTLTQHQFMHLVDLFLGEETPRSLANELAVYLKDNYVETRKSKQRD
eukprot:Em0015g1146a